MHTHAASHCGGLLQRHPCILTKREREVTERSSQRRENCKMRRRSKSIWSGVMGSNSLTANNSINGHPSNGDSTTGFASGSADDRSSGDKSLNSLVRYNSKTTKAVWIGRGVFLASLAAVAVGLGFATYYLLVQSEMDLANRQFQSIADRAIHCIQAAARAKRKGSQSLAEVVASAHPDAQTWPNAAVEGFEGMAADLIDVSKGCNMALCTLVRVGEELEAYENYIYDWYHNRRIPQPWDNTTGISSFGRGVFAVNKTLNTTDNRFHNINAKSMLPNDYVARNEGKLLAPLMQHSTGASKGLMKDIYASSPVYAPMVDNLLECAQRRKQAQNLSIQCGSIAPLIKNKTSWIAKIESGPGTSMLQPIYPINDPYEPVAFIGTGIVWGELLSTAFPPGVNGVNVVLRTGNDSYTWNIEGGKAKLAPCQTSEHLPGEGDLHDARYDKFATPVVITEEELFSNTSIMYTMTVYPTKDIYRDYRTSNPLFATIGCVLIITVMAFSFFTFDTCVRREFNAKNDLLEAKRKFVAFVSHEVRTPLNSVCMGLALVREGIETSINQRPKPIPVERAEEWHSLTQEIYCNTRASVDVLNDLLNYDKVETGALSLELSLIPIMNLIQNTIDEFKLPAAKKNIQLEVDLPSSDSKRNLNGQGCLVVGDAIRLRQVLRNLTSNAIKFTPDSGSLNVKATWLQDKDHRSPYTSKKNCCEDKEDQFNLENGEIVVLPRIGSVLIEVTDSGVGLTKEQTRRVFNQGTQFNVNKLQAGQGSGLGLFIAKGIVEQHKGSLSVRSDGVGKGTTFSIVLPLYHESSKPICSDSTESPSLESPNHGCDEDETEAGGQRILVIEDAPMNRKLLIRLLENHGHTVDGAEDGAIGVEMVKAAMEAGNPYDTILTDNHMPVMDGLAATKRIREMGCDSFMVGVTGNVVPEDVASFRMAGVNAVLAKPFQMSELTTLWNEQNVSAQQNADQSSPALCFQFEQMPMGKNDSGGLPRPYHDVEMGN